MSSFGAMIIFIVVMVLAYFITGAILKIIVKNNILDHPGSRSLHEIPLPRGGGISITILFLFCLIVVWQQDYIHVVQFSAFFIGGMVVFVIGLLDDIKPIPVLIKGPGYFIAALWGVCLLEAGQAST
ncbi:MAG: hypothetical protein HKN08_08815, partial [Gammaproteobacteria bacterium]|nr:hypothetical protein [Gammaproteobacteria bacterium]